MLLISNRTILPSSIYTSLLGDCNRLNCSAFGAACQVENGLAKCECDFACADPGPVCGSDGKTYPSRCHLRRERCAEQKDIKFVFEDKGCGKSNQKQKRTTVP